MQGKSGFLVIRQLTDRFEQAGGIFFFLQGYARMIEVRYLIDRFVVITKKPLHEPKPFFAFTAAQKIQGTGSDNAVKPGR